MFAGKGFARLQLFVLFGGSNLESLILVILLCDLVPVLIAARLFPALMNHAPRQVNYRGVKVLGGLGVVWFIWLIMLCLCSVVLRVLDAQEPYWLRLLLSAFPLLACTCALGLFDDWTGDSSSRGFKGHFRLLKRGLLTTGMVKFIGIGLMSLVMALSLADTEEQFWVLRVICATCVMALFANFLNLMDLRPLRASKVYLLCLAFCMLALFLTHRLVMDRFDVLCMVLACLGPVIATWYFDAWEIAMLGDAGANTMGALLGYLLVLTLPIWLLVPLTILMFAINLLSERVSFSKVIEKIPVLKNLDRMFRPKRILNELDAIEKQNKKSNDAR